MVRFKGAHFETPLILTCVGWYFAYPLSYRQLEEMMQERGVLVDHATINRWVLKYAPQLAEAFHRRKRPAWSSWRMDGPIARSKASGTICIGRWIRLARRLTSCSPSSEMSRRPRAS
jgi:putative transposase